MAQPDALNARKLSDGTSGHLQICGRRLQQVRGTKMVLGTYDVMRLADAEFSLRVRSRGSGSRFVARLPLEGCCELSRRMSSSAALVLSWDPEKEIARQELCLCS